MEVNTCRVCLNESSEAYVSIFENHGADKMSTILKHVTGIEIRINSQWPNKICKVCWNDAVTAYALKNRFIESDNKLKILLQESDPFFNNINVKVELQELVIDEHQIVKTELIELDFQNFNYEEEPVIESNINIKEIDELVIESKICKNEIDNPSQKIQEKPRIFACVKCVQVIKNRDPIIAVKFFRKHMLKHNREKHMCLQCEPHLRFAQEIHLQHHNYILHGIGENPLICKECDFISDIEDKNYWNNQRAHLKTHNKSDRFACDLCFPLTNHFSEIRLLKHQFVQHKIGDNPLTCDKCKETFETIMKFKKHNDETGKCKPISSRNVEKLSCDLCFPLTYYRSEIKLQYHQFYKHKTAENPYVCSICKKTFRNPTRLKRHNDEKGRCKPIASTKTEVAKTYKCYICDEIFAMFVTKIEHINKHHADKANGDCHLCLRKRIPSASAFEKHLSEHFTEFTCICNYCGRGFHEESRLNNHIKYLHETKYIFCDICGAKNKSKQSLRKHMQTIHLKMRNYKCNECPRDYTSSATLEKHQVREHGAEPRYKCLKCSAGYTYRDEYNRHFLACTPGIYVREERRANSRNLPTPLIKNGRTICSVCHKDYVSQASWMSHYYAEHIYEKQIYECEICHKVSNKLGNHKKHMLIHSEEKPHVCDICNKAFAQKTVLQTHRRIHTGEKPYSCTICSKAFSDQSTRSKHIKNTHKST